ncbi:MAG: SDR family NAD(P)-dependent oxidoreductase [Syntrophaceae bacterium]|nr:SDR family NAD(P)-dependent oxidoreductase [Syntrophaceae bacterium]
MKRRFSPIRGIAIEFAKQGAKVTATDRNRDGLAEMEKEIQASGGEGLIVGTELTDTDDIERIVASTVERLGGVDILVNVAGIFELSDFTEMTESFTIESWMST